jgi:broad specificity phosphatase PhoE
VTRSLERIVLSMALLLGLSADALAQRAIVLVRHAEKLDQSEDSVLSAAGLSRADALADLLRGADVTLILTTEYRRTQATAAPLARRLQMSPDVVPAREHDQLLMRLSRAPADAVVLVVGHSNTLPIILARLGWKGTLTLTDRDYDDAFVVVPRANAEPAVVRLKYGQSTTP